MIARRTDPEHERAASRRERLFLYATSCNDQGMGITREQRARRFARFSRVSNTSANGITGTGLGLFLCYELIERHGGRIWLESEEGKGTSFSFLLPFTPPDEALNSPAQACVSLELRRPIADFFTLSPIMTVSYRLSNH